jgi:hypothetical protein
MRAAAIKSSLRLCAQPGSRAWESEVADPRHPIVSVTKAATMLLLQGFREFPAVVTVPPATARVSAVPFVSRGPWNLAVASPKIPEEPRSQVAGTSSVPIGRPGYCSRHTGRLPGSAKADNRNGLRSRLRRRGTPFRPETKRERSKTMKKSEFIRGLAALAVCALALPVIASLKHPVERPLKASGAVITIVDAVTGEFVVDETSGSSVGVSTHIGRFTAEGSGNAWTGDWSLTMTAANGDQICGNAVPAPPAPGVPLEFRFTSGTGRFEGISGEMTYVISNLSIVPNPDDPTGMTVILSYTWVGTGTVTY